MANSRFVSRLNQNELQALKEKLNDIQLSKCFICHETVDLQLHEGHLELDHIRPLRDGGPDTENNLALTHASCNRNKGASDLRVARCLEELKSLQHSAEGRGDRGANLADVLAQHGGAKNKLPLKVSNGVVEYSFSGAGQNDVFSSQLYRDEMSGMDYFFCLAPLEYIHHDDFINPRSIGSNIRGLIEEFLRERPQLHIGLAWWAPDDDGAGTLKLFDGQHKAAAQILLGSKKLPVRVFVNPDVNILMQANTSAGSSLRQVAFNKSVMRHLGSSLYRERAERYQKLQGLDEDDYSFSEQDLVKHFRGEKRQMERYIIDAQRDAITRSSDNSLLEFIEWSGKGTERPMAYSTLDSAFFQLLCQKALSIPIDQGVEREIERRQMVRLMSLFAEIFFIGKWDHDTGGRRLENRIQRGEAIADAHLRAWRVSREEITINIIRWVRLVINNHNAVNSRQVELDSLFLEEFPESLWGNIERFLLTLSQLPCWTNPELSSSVFGPKQNLDYWESIFKTGKSTSNTLVLAQPLNLQDMIAQP